MHQSLYPRYRHESPSFHPRTQEHRFCRPIDGVFVSRTECPPNLKFSRQRPKSPTEWEHRSVRHHGGVPDELYRTNTLRIRERPVTTGSSITHAGASDELYKQSNPETRECPKPIGASVILLERPLELEQSQSEATHHGAQYSRVSVSRTECPTITMDVRIVSKCTQQTTKASYIQ
jgi:hypothetical protein